MDSIIANIVSLLTYSGPSLQELVNEAINNGYKYEIYESKDCTTLEIYSMLPYNVAVKDKYSFSKDAKMIKHLVCINEREDIVFDKFKEASELISIIAKYQKTA